jgi:hypothetical protein
LAGEITAASSIREAIASDQFNVVRTVTCAHCWHRFRPARILWVSQHEDLVGDPVLKDEPLRFLPTRFTLEGQAIDARGMVCHAMACPQCHMPIPRLLLENEVTFLSLIGSVGSGKSNFLAAMTWELRQQLARHFAILFTDGDKEANWVLNRYEETLFLPADPDRPIFLEKTGTHGDLYKSVRISGQEIQLPKPFLFSFHPTGIHPRAAQAHRAGSVVCLYDNAGEHYGVGQDTAMTPVTRHLSHARALMFLFDPTQDTRFRTRCKQFSKDPQILDAIQSIRQETILTEAALRIRKHLGLSPYQKHTRPLLVLVGKSDVWGPLLGHDITSEPVGLEPTGTFPLAMVDMMRVEKISDLVRMMLLEVSPEIVAVAEDFSNEVVYIPVSALGRSPERQPDNTGLFVRPRDVQPRWVTVPMLYAFARWFPGLIAGYRPAPAVSTGKP